MGNILDFREFLRTNVSDDVLAAIVKNVQGGNRDAARGIGEDVKEGKYTKQVARDLFPHVRRARIETCLFDLASEFPEVAVTPQMNKTFTNYHTRVRCGNVIMTASAVLTPRGLAREADFRNGYAGAQMRFDIDRSKKLSPVALEEPSGDEILYGIILYCAAENNRLEVATVHLGFPNWSHTRYLECINLMALFPETAKKTETEQIEDQAIVSLLLDDEELLSLRGKQDPDKRV